MMEIPEKYQGLDRSMILMCMHSQCTECHGEFKMGNSIFRAVDFGEGKVTFCIHELRKLAEMFEEVESI